MKRFVSWLPILLILLLVPAFAGAQAKATAPTKQKLILEDVTGGVLSVTTPDNVVMKYPSGIDIGDAIPLGSTIVTGATTTAELKLMPNTSILKIAKSTTFTVQALAGSAKEPNAFALVAGKMRAVAAKGAQYKVTTGTAVAAVRGTDFSIAYEEGVQAQLMVAKGLVEYAKLDQAGAVLATVPVAAGQAADAFAATFAAFKFSPEQFAQQYSDVNFTKLKESDVAALAPEAASPDQGTANEGDKNNAPAPDSPFVKWLKDALGFEIGSVTIDNNTYSKAIVQPNLALGKVKLGLYLPVIYSSNLFDPQDWYHPKGNDEWSFGTTQFANKDYVGGVADFATDLALKIKYFEYGEQLKDPFFIKVGNLEDLTLGHGLIMRNYANDTDFPSIRRLGFETGLDLGGGGFELVANDLTDLQIFGGRFYFRPIKESKLALGFSAAVDWNAASIDPALGIAAGGLKLIGTGVDIDLPIIQSSLLGLRLFADGAVALPYTTVKIGSNAPGLQYQLVFDSNTNTMKNWGAAGGAIGNVLFIDWRLEYRYFTGNFRPSFFDGTYDRMRGQYAAQYIGYLSSPSSYDATPNVMGIYGEGGFKLLKDKLVLNLGYMWPFSLDAGTSIQQQLVQSSDELHASLVIKKGLIPFIDLAGSINYEKRGVARALASNSFQFIDGNTLFGGELDLPVPKTPNLDLAILFQTVPVLDGAGNVQYATPADAAKGLAQVKPSITIETKFHF